MNVKNFHFKKDKTYYFFIEMIGFLKNDFVLKNPNNESEYFGVVTDGEYKLDVLLIKQNQDQKINFTRGEKLEMIGDLQENGIQ